jgi:hypothetical protein
MKKSELKEYIREAILAELSEAVFVGPGAVDDITTNASFQKVKDKNSVINALKKGELVALEETDDDDESMYDKEPTKSDLKKEKIKGAPSKFEISKEDYEDFKTRLKNLVGKIKDMEKGETRDKKMAALKQFIKNPRLVKAFKERDVRIDTDGLIG